MKNPLFVLLFFLACGMISPAQGQALGAASDTSDHVHRIIETLASDDMRGRSALSIADITKAADFIAGEFREIGLVPYAEDDYRQSFQTSRSKLLHQTVRLADTVLQANQYLIVGDGPNESWSQNDSVKSITIGSQEDFSQAFRNILQQTEGNTVVWVDPIHATYLARFKQIFSRESIKIVGEDANTSPNTKVFIVAHQEPKQFLIEIEREKTEFPMFNVAGILPGKSKPNEYVVFSCHYDHIGIIDAVGTDSIANGADDDASGTTAMIELARYFQQQDINERTLIFVAFTAEEIGMFGSKYFSHQIDPDSVIAMINIEMIGKDSKFGPNSLYITGYDASDLGSIMQQNVQGSNFSFHPDPYPTQNLFYRSDNAVLAALGVPAHTFSTSQIDKDSYYHTVKDEVSTLNIEHIRSSIEAIALGVKGIVNGSQTPSRVEKLRD